MKYYDLKSLTGSAVPILSGIAFLVAVVLVIFWLIWSLWTFVLGQVWADGPQAIVNPGYWLFIAEWILLGMIGRRIFGGKKSD